MATVKKTIFQLRERVIKVLKSGRPKQIKKLKKAYGGRYLKNLWASRASFEGLTIAECKDIEGVGIRMKGGHRHNHVRNCELRLMLSKKEIYQLRRQIRGIQRTRRSNDGHDCIKN